MTSTDKKNVYYAHSVHLYDTPQEKRDIELLEQLGYNVINPNAEVHKAKCAEIKNKWNQPIAPYSGDRKEESSKEIMQYFFKEVIAQCDVLAYRAYPDMRIGAGVWGEIACANTNKIPVFELPTILDSRQVSVKETRQMLEYLGER